MANQPPFRTGDSILHKPSGETWVCAWADPATGYLSWLGWPPGEASISDFELAKAATDDEHRKWRRDLKRSTRRDVARALRLYGDPDITPDQAPPRAPEEGEDLRPGVGQSEGGAVVSVGMPVEALYARPRINWRHIDGPVLMWAGNIHWLTWRERIAFRLGRATAETIAQARWPERKEWAIEALIIGWEAQS